jgi:hypothetical protein
MIRGMCAVMVCLSVTFFSQPSSLGCILPGLVSSCSLSDIYALLKLPLLPLVGQSIDYIAYAATMVYTSLMTFSLYSSYNSR